MAHLYRAGIGRQNITANMAGRRILSSFALRRNICSAASAWHQAFCVNERGCCSTPRSVTRDISAYRVIFKITGLMR